MAKLGYDQYQSIRFRSDHALWADAGLAFRLQFFHVGRNFTEPVHLYEVIDGQSREILYDPAMFEWDKSGVDPSVMKDRAGFAGFRVQFVTDWRDDVAAFLGASYFRAVGGDTRQYGLSARALAVDTAFPRPEEFPRFTSFWFERPAKDAGVLTLYALLDSPSIAGALRMQISPGGTQIMNIDSALYPRKPIERIGIAPLTSMFFYGENDRRAANDWRPEIHDSDGLSMWTGAGEWIWRPLVNPAQLHLNSYFDDNPRGFGLLQRDRDFDHYQDDGVYYDRRPSLWVEPKPGPNGGWGKGAVQLVEIPTVDETFDNIVAFWNPLDKPKPGQELLFGYRLYWGKKMPYSSPLGQTLATRTGIGGTVGVKRQYYSWHFAVDFTGGELGALPKDSPVEAVITASRGTTEHVTAHYVQEFGGLPGAVRRPAARRFRRAHRSAAVLADRGQAADRNLDLPVDAALAEGAQGRHPVSCGRRRASLRATASALRARSQAGSRCVSPVGLRRSASRLRNGCAARGSRMAKRCSLSCCLSSGSSARCDSASSPVPTRLLQYRWKYSV